MLPDGISFGTRLLRVLIRSLSLPLRTLRRAALPLRRPRLLLPLLLVLPLATFWAFHALPSLTLQTGSLVSLLTILRFRPLLPPLLLPSSSKKGSWTSLSKMAISTMTLWRLRRFAPLLRGPSRLTLWRLLLGPVLTLLGLGLMLRRLPCLPWGLLALRRLPPFLSVVLRRLLNLALACPRPRSFSI